MNLNTKLLKLNNITGLQVEPDVYTGDDEEWITFNYVDENPSMFADDKAIEDVADMQVHLYVQDTTNYFELKHKIRDYLENIGGYGVSISTVYEKDTKKRHIIFEFEYAEGRN